MGYSILVGVPSELPEHIEQRMINLIRCALGGEVSNIAISRSVDSFLNKVSSGAFNVFLCVDNLGMGNEYFRYVNPYGVTSGGLCILLIPDYCHGTESLKRVIEMGYNNVIFQRDFSIEGFRNLVYNTRSVQNALAYGGLTHALAVREDEKKEEQKSRIQKRYVGDGVGITRLLGQDAIKQSEHEFGDKELLDLLQSEDALDASLETMGYKEFPQDEEWVSKFKSELRTYFRNQGIAQFQAFEHGDLERTKFEEIVYSVLEKMNLSGDNAWIVIKSFMKDTLSYGKIDELITTEGVSDIRLMSKDVINVQHFGVWYRTNVRFATSDEYTSFINRICMINHAPLNMREADSVFTDALTYSDLILRITASHSMLSANSTYSTCIRVASRNKKTAQDLIKDGYWTKKQAAILINAVKNKKSIIICGGSGAGKTILLNALIEYLPPGICGSCIQQSDELHSKTHQNIEFQHSVEAVGEGGVEYSLLRLATKALLKNVEAFLIGEIKGGEAKDFVIASRTAVVYATTHAEDFSGAIPRCAELAVFDESNFTKDENIRTLAKNVDYVVYCEKYRCKQIAKVVGYDDVNNDVIYELYDFNAKEEDYR